MSKQKYYVLLRDRNVGSLGLGGRCNGWINYNWSSELNSFTENELCNIFDGALYKQSDCLPFEWLYSREQLRNDLGWEYNETIDKWEWKNQLIELVPVEEV